MQHLNRTINMALFGLLSIIPLNCSNKQNDVVTTEDAAASGLIVLDSNYPAIADTIRVCQFVDSLFYIPLSSTKPDKIEQIEKVIMTDSLIFVQDALSGLYMFTREGVFLRKIANECWGFDVLEPAQRVYVAYKNRIRVYDYMGNIIHSKIPLSRETEGIGNFIAAIDTGKIAVAVWNRGVEANRLVIIGNDGHTVKAFPNNEKFQSKRLPLQNALHFQRMLFRYHDEVRYHPYYSDTLFALSKDQLHPVFVENRIFKTPLHQRLEYLGDLNEFNSYFNENMAYATRFFETSRFVLVVSNIARMYQTFPNYLLYDKQTSKLYDYQQKFILPAGHYHFGIFNDYDGGLPFNPVYNSGEYLIETFEAGRFAREYTHGRDLGDCNSGSAVCTYEHYDLRSDCYSSLDRKNRIEQISRQLTKDNNPVLMVAKLKK